MDRNQAKEFYPIIQAFVEGKVIECRTKLSLVKDTGVQNEWKEMEVIEFWGISMRKNLKGITVVFGYKLAY